MDDSGPTIDPALNPGDVGPALTGPDPEAAIYTCPSCGGERAAHDFLSHDTQSYNECCSLCMSGWHAEALAMHHHPRQHGHDGTAAVDHALAMHEHEPMHGYTPQHTQHERYLSVRQLLADEAVGPQLGQDASSRGPLLRHGGGGGIGDGGMHGPDSHAMHEMPAGHAHTPLLGPPADMPGSSATTAALKAYHEMHAAGLIGFAFPQEIPSGLAGQQQDPAAGTPYHDMQAVSAATKQLADMTRDQPAIKQCSKCKTAKHLHDFPLLKGKSAGERGAQCCQCRGAVHRSQYQDMNSTGVVASDGEESERGEPHAAAATNVLANLYLPMVREKQCGHCGVVKPAAAFRRVRNKSDHLQSRCKECEAVLGRGARRTTETAPAARVAHKLCTSCGQTKRSDDFFASKTSLDGLYTYCKPCHRVMNKASRDKRAPAAPTQLPDTKTCRICQQSKPADQFYRGRVNQDGLYSYCKACATKIDTQRKKEYRQRKRAEAAAAAGAEGGGVAVGGVSVEARERLRAVTAGGSGLGSSLGGQYGTGAESIVDGIAGFDASGGYGGGYVHAAQAGAQYQDPQYQTYPGAEYDPEGVLQYDAPGGHGAQPHYHFHDQQYHFAPDHAQHATGVYRQPDMMHYEHAVDPGAALDPGMLNVPKVHSAMHTTGGVQGVEHGS